MLESEYIASPDILEPETLRSMFPFKSDAEIEKLLALKAVKVSNTPYENFYTFQKVVLALNGIAPNFTMMEDITPEQIWYAIHEMRMHNPAGIFSPEIVLYVQKVFNNNGLYFYPPGLDVEDNSLLPKVIANVSKHELSDDIFIDRQTYNYLRIQTHAESH